MRNFPKLLGEVCIAALLLGAPLAPAAEMPLAQAPVATPAALARALPAVQVPIALPIALPVPTMPAPIVAAPTMPAPSLPPATMPAAMAPAVMTAQPVAMTQPLAAATSATAAAGAAAQLPALAMPAPAARTTAAPGPGPVAAAPANGGSAGLAGEHGRLVMETGTGRVITLTGTAANIFVADPKVAEVRPASPTSLFVFGVSPGHTTVAALDGGGHVLAQYDLTVQPSSFGAESAQAMIARLLPGSRVLVQAQAKGLLLTGTVGSPADAAQAVAIAKGYAGDTPLIDNEMSVMQPLQVTLNVRIAQMSREVVRKLGINWSALGSIGQIGELSPALKLTASTTTTSITTTCPACRGAGFLGVIDALANDNLAQVLAEPNLTVMSGQPASFQVGGEYPIPVASGANGQITVTYKNYGVLLSFLPTVLSDGRIDLHVKPEVSELSSVNAAQVTSGNTSLQVPSLIVRRAETTVQLGSGQSFAIAGLLQQNTTDSGSGVPGAGDIPLLGALFHDDQLQRTETELVVVVTPYIVRPVNNPSDLRLPTDGYNTPTDLERLFLMRQVADKKTSVPLRIPGDAGFMVQ
jgi:pilus assembly protein CpaC